ncbi:25S rRNA (cytosine-C(5))-methyltransferase [Trichophyton mentagrophytes]|nr:25S rRNA (cytosine-C(5))-methyltransferase [Trichophyton mentagrophytes]
MGVGRRIGKKQGPPQPLEEFTIKSGKKTVKKRKADKADSAPKGVKRRRGAEDDGDGDEERPKSAKTNGAKAGKKDFVKQKNTKAPITEGARTKDGKKKVAKPVEVSEAEDSEEDMDDEMLDDEFGDLDGVSDGSADDMDALDQEDSDLESHSAFDSDEERPREKMFSDDEDLSDAEEILTAANIEGLSKKLDMQKEEEAAQAELELKEAAMQTNIAGDAPDVFAEHENLTAGLAPNLQLLRTRITDTIRILGDLSTLGQPGKSRADYTDLLLNDICVYYGYTPYLAEKLFSLFTPMEAFSFFEANESPRPIVIRTNTLRTNRRSLAQALINRGVVLEPVGKWSKVGLQVFESPVPLGATPEYLAGHYILQAASSFLPVMALAPQPHERILDMAAAPGGKTTYASALMRNTGSILANDASKTRAKGLIGNIHRLGCKNTIVSNMDARTAFPKAIGGFDRVLLDAPCSGTGVISKDPKVKTSKTERDFLALPHMQKQLLLAAIDSTNHASKTGGYIVYSTCSVTVEENEGVVQYALRKRPNVKIVDTGLGNFGTPGFKSYMNKKFDDRMLLTRRYYPHRENVDGFFVCKLKKTGPSPAETTQKAPGTSEGNGGEEIIDRTPITPETGDTDADGFGPFNEEEDEQYISRAQRNKLRRQGVNPKAVINKKSGQDSENHKQKKQKGAKEKKDISA